MKKLVLLAFLIGIGYFSFAQMTLSSGSQIVIANGSTLVANSVVNNNGTIDVDGTVEIKGNLENNTSGLMTSTSTGTVKFNGSSSQEISGDADAAFYGNVEIDNSNGVSIKTSNGHDQTIHGTLEFTDGLLTLNEYDLTLVNDATTPGDGKYVYTNSTGEVKRSVPADGSTNITFPVGKGSYNPLILQNSVSATTDNYGVRVVDSEPAGASTTHMVDRSWVVTEETSGNSDLTVTAQWSDSQENTPFDETNCAVGLTSDGGTSYTWGTVGSATGSDPYTQIGSGFTGVGTFAVGDYYYGGLEIDLKVILAAAWNGTNMDNTINGLLPLTDPYDGTTTVSSIPASAVDWVKVELRNGADNTNVLHSFARFVDQDGQIIEENENNLTLTGVLKDSYYIAILHRNHFGVISDAVLNLNLSQSLSFIDGTEAWQNPGITTNNAMKDLGSGVYGMWNGDANGDGEIKVSGANDDKQAILNLLGVSTPGNVVSGYNPEDVNMDGDAKVSGANDDKQSILNVLGISTPGNVFSEHIPE